MSRRKQACPSRHIASPASSSLCVGNSHNGSGRGGSSTGGEEESSDDEHVCGRCRAEFPTLDHFLAHKRCCPSVESMGLPGSTPSRLSCSDDDAAGRQSASDAAEVDEEPSVAARLPSTHVALEALQSTKVAVAQFAYGSSGGPAEIAALHEALMALQQQQVVQLHIIQQLQAYVGASPALPVNLTRAADSTPPPPAPPPPRTVPSPEAPGGQTHATPPPPNTVVDLATKESAAPEPADPPAAESPLGEPMGGTLLVAPPAGPPPPDEPNTLELLQRHTEKALQDTMSGGSFLLNGLGSPDPSRLRRKGDGRPDEAYLRHRCRFCGKVFGSDSALQIHIRSHTGERPFKCNVCGNRFSTKGNLKVHFQRHRAKYPHVRMNPHPVPEHLDKHFPPLEPPGDRSPTSPSGATSSPPPSLQPALALQPAPLGVLVKAAAPRPEDLVRPSCSGALALRATRSTSPGSERTSNVTTPMTSAELESERPLSLKAEPEDEADDKVSDEDRDSCGVSGSADDSMPFTSAGSFLSGSFSTLQTTADAAVPLHADPAFYQDLLPKPGSNDNSWETLMEVTRPSETSKLQQLVDNIEHKLSDPNQCVICHRVLSCRSALQMHYRTHTGERPFRCKICGRAFTTKGNLKTHMGVHRVKPPLRVLHKCPVCHKQFTNSLVLQQHVRMHGSESLHATQSFQGTSQRPTPPPKTSSSPPPSSPTSPAPEQKKEEGRSPSPQPLMRPLSPERPPSQLTSLAALENQVKGIKTSLQVPALPFGPFGMGLSSGFGRFDDQSLLLGRTPETGQRSPAFSPRAGSELSTGDERSTPGAPSPSGGTSPPVNGGPLDLTPRTLLGRPADSFSGRFFAAPPLGGLPFPGAAPGRPNTTCQICFKTFACNSALEIHYRSHTKERPFKCSVCERGFSTKGNLKQHMLTHKIRDLPATLFAATPSAGASGPSPAPSPGRSASPCSEQRPGASPDESRTKRVEPGGPPPPPPPPQHQPRRPPGLPRHVCHVCNKPFSSSSSLQIHMRTHTGDRPFKCSVCGRAFTTKGNLKVHMGTHMWNNGSSRRGRRMSIELPSLLSGPKADFVPPPPPPHELFYPYLGPAYLNGMLGPKANEISVIQGASTEPRPGDEAEPQNGAWAWKMACNLCAKICGSSLELEAHLKAHHRKELEVQSPDNVAV
ncbi:sal-like protein 1 isoform X2 [Amblyomma americanum]